MAGETITTTVTSTVTLGSGAYTGPLYIENTGFLNPSLGVGLIIPGSDVGGIVLNEGTIQPRLSSQEIGYNAVDMYSASSITNAATIIGGEGGFNRSTGGGQTGGAGVLLGAAGAKLENGGFIYGGTGGTATEEGSTGGTGGAGVIIDTGATLVNETAIYGGAGGSDFDPINKNTGGVGGDGVDLKGGLLINTLLIFGGSGGNGSSASLDGAGGLGVSIASGTLDNAGSVYGTYGTSGYSNAVVFGSLSAGTLVVQEGGQFFGKVVASTAVKDALVVGSTYTNDRTTGSSFIDLSGIGTEFTGFSQIDFSNAGTFEIEGNASGLASGQTISGFTLGDTIGLDGFTATSELYDGSHLTLANSSGQEVLNVGSVGNNSFVLNTTSIAGTEITLEANAPCFAAGTHILTLDGEKRVEDLVVGDQAVLFDGRVADISWIGYRTVNLKRHPKPELVIPIMIRAGAISQGLPERDLIVSPDHAFFFDGRLIPAKVLENGHSIYRLTDMAKVTYYHIELPTHDILVAEGVATESYLECGNRNAFENSGMPIMLHTSFNDDERDAFRIANSCGVFADEGEFVERIRASVLVRADIVTTNEPMMEVYIKDGVGYIESRTSVPGLLLADPRDRRTLGVKVQSIEIDGMTVSIDHEDLVDGWNYVECDGRWTMGKAVIPASLINGASSLKVNLSGVVVYAAKTSCV
jgi:collagen type I/II/III/V/XI/XXIV/XXVII alpha